MIVISGSLIISIDDSFSLDNPLIGYSNQVIASNLAASSNAGGYPYTNMANPATHLFWRGTTTSGTEDIYIYPLSGPVDYVGIARHNFGTAGISVALQTSLDGVNYVTQGSAAPANDDPIMFWFANDEYVSIRVRLTVGATAAQIAVIYAGEVLRLQRRIYVGHTPVTMGRKTQAITGRSEAGHFLGRVVVGEHRTTSVKLENLTASWLRTYLDPFLIHAQETPFFFAWRPTSYPLEVGYCWMTNEPRPINQRANGMMQIDMEFSGIA